MARVIAPFKLRGRIGNLIFFENEFGPQVKAASGPTEWHIKHDENFKRALRNAAEWKAATAASKLLREAMGTLVNGVKNMRLSSRMNGPLLKAIQADPVHGWGERRISCGDPSVLTDFEFNHNLSLDDALPHNVENCYAMEGDTVRLQIPAFRIRKKKILPEKATHYRLVSAVITVDFDKRRYQRDIQVSPLHAMGRKAGEAFFAEHSIAASTPGSFWLVGIEFFTMEKDGPTLLKGGAIRAMGWLGPTADEQVDLAETGKQEIPVGQEDVPENSEVKEDQGVRESVVASMPDVDEKPAMTASTPSLTPAPVVKINYVSSGQQSSNLTYLVGQNGWYGTSSGMKKPGDQI